MTNDRKTSYYDNGNIKYSIDYFSITFWFENKNLKKRIRGLDNDYSINEETWFENGDIKRRVWTDRNSQIISDNIWNSNGIKTVEVDEVDGEEWIYLNYENGTHASTVEFFDDRNVLEIRQWDEDGIQKDLIVINKPNRNWKENYGSSPLKYDILGTLPVDIQAEYQQLKKTLDDSGGDFGSYIPF